MDHEWRLSQPVYVDLHVGEYGCPPTSIMSWECNKCNSKIIVSVDDVVHDGNAHFHTPSWGRMNELNISQNCNDQLCENVIEI